MLLSESGAKVIGFAGVMHCVRCQNSVVMQVRQEYLKQSFMFIPMGNTHFHAFLFCPTCEFRSEIDDSKGLFTSKDYHSKVIGYLEDGKSHTKIWYEKLDSKEKEEMLKRLNELKAYSVVKFLAG